MTVYQGNIVQPHINVPGRGATFGTVPLKVRFWAKVKKTKTCWNWIGSFSGNGRGQINIGGKPKSASRTSWVMHKGKIPRGLHVLHKCDNPKCIRPSHLFLGTHAENMADMKNKGRAAVISSEKRSAMVTPKARKAKSKDMKRRRWINNGIVNARIDKDKKLPRGFSTGRLPNKKRKYPAEWRLHGLKHYMRKRSEFLEQSK